MTVSVSFDIEILKKIDEARGLVKRSNWVEEAVKEALKGKASA